MTSEQNRRAFVSHTYPDRVRAEELARALRVHGVESWLDKWEIQPGDSLVQKIFEEGLRNCGVFLVLLSQASVNSRWVQEELDAALIRRIEGATRVIPVKLEACKVPIALRALQYVDLAEGVNPAAKRIADVVFGIREVPPVAAPPSQLSFSVPGLSRLAARVAVHIWPAFETGSPRQFEGNQLVNALAMTVDDVNDAVEELEDRGLVEVHRYLGSAPFQFGTIWPTYALAHELRGTPAMSYDPEEDALVVANAIASERSTDGARLAAATKLPANRINAAVDFLEDRGLATVYRAMGGGPFTFFKIDATGATRRFVANNG
ncbi:MAG: toll/interleukin-1 receptor domain-containing protein [Deltaproteobacteria bacterium]|nr:toll/interleukin-1 receptor domain-containing protein [Deltaproteobacteria bacterium]